MRCRQVLRVAVIVAGRRLADVTGLTGHHRYYGSSAINGGERIVENRRGQRPRFVNLCG
ncbi:hypothetical protein [Bradyrhizobium sp. sBnM-33]|uniref:hypothetical protein n=1 Tax=Bradyrhizobium sp. sBnM-33 TaxID=2831780 RepID=UPI001BD104BB|nr:hypothetical protein [Bradyrhizobium sp. sBnM-33]WOH54364.1 hypothetical protein RX328_20980 [Bradyrhizobium sp. sBnM-33]